MAKDRFRDISDISTVLEMLTGEVTSDTPLQEARDAIRKHSAKKLERAYSNAARSVDFEYSSAKHYTAGLVGLLSDAFYTCGAAVNELTQSDFVKQYAPDLATGNEKRERLVQALTDRCEETGKSPEKLLKSTKDMVGIIETSYGSLADYEHAEISRIRTLSGLVDKIELLESMPLGIVIPAFVKARFNIDLPELGVSPSALGKISRTYLKDVATFGKAFLTEVAKETAREVEKYRTEQG